ncbi:hypothetical protein KNT64_gp190 [Pseudomonas phage PspYZU05]|uniref:Uncharacterized protein n=1 Tax=Pseudomonas phage PspYZU05 TaxID=1983556 RepID=A0A2U7NS25_9CAUD|nr:hypothetical protein KNT64_gp190 [Pseudomonas phage PspYZU05]ASD52142.1 hypothetical protein PspYZU05_190 [Pseudomonas phage PspYZU05]
MDQATINDLLEQFESILANIDEISSTHYTGICSLIYHRSGKYSEMLLDNIFTNWPKFSGSKTYPVPAINLGKAFEYEAILMTESELKRFNNSPDIEAIKATLLEKNRVKLSYSISRHNRTLWKGENLELRKDLINFAIHYLKDLRGNHVSK